MSYKVENLVKGGATVLFANVPVGWTREATVLSQEDDKIIVDDVQQIQGVVDVRRTKVGWVVKCNLYEYTMENIRLAFGVNAQITLTGTAPSQKKKLLFNMSEDYHEGELLIYGKGSNNVNRTIRFYKAKLIERGDVSIDAHNFTVIPVTFQVLVHPDYDEVGYVEQEYTPVNVID